MESRGLLVSGMITLALLTMGIGAVRAQGDVALNGVVSSPQEGEMEGVVVTARRDGANFDVSVVSDAEGRYSFLRTHLVPGTYTVKVRAVGYDLGSPGAVDVPAGDPATLDLALDTTSDLSSQITTVEWLTSVPGSDEDKGMLVKPLLSCIYCHSVERIVKSRHTAERFVNVISRMQTYFPDGSMAGTEGRGRAVQRRDLASVADNPIWYQGVTKAKLAEYLASINLSDGRSLPDDLKTLPRPTGQETRVIITQYDMPRKDTVPHDMDVDSQVAPWYTDQSALFLGTMDPATATFTEYPLPEAPSHEYGGASDVQVDLNDNVWFSSLSDRAPASHFGQPKVFDRRTETIVEIDMPEGASTQFFAIGPDGKIWTGGTPAGGSATFYRINPVTREVDYSIPWAEQLPGRRAGYEIAVDPQGNPYITDFFTHAIAGVDVETDSVESWPVPTPNSNPRRGKIDQQDRYWFAEFSGDKIAMFNTRTKEFTEWALDQFTAPYTVSLPDASGRVYAPSSTSDRLFRLDPTTGEVLGYLMPTRDFDTKTISYAPDGRTLWMANTRNARLIKVEPLD